MSRPTIDQLLDEVRAGLPPRPGPADLDAVWAGGGLVIDTRPAALRARDGELPGAVVVERNVLEWRLDPTSPHRLDEARDHDQQIVVVCDEGYASSLAAASLQVLGLWRATDLDGGYQAWRRHHEAAPTKAEATPASAAADDPTTGQPSRPATARGAALSAADGGPVAVPGRQR